MDDDSKFGSMVKWGLGAVGLGAAAAAFALPRPFGIYVALAILILAVLFIGGYFLWRKMRARRQSRAFSSAIEAQTAAAPKAISDPNQKAALDKLRQKFQTGMQEFKSRGKDIYKLPWHVIIGESGSGKTEAIRHSGVEFPPGLQDELQGSGGTVNMDWWFTNRGIILDTAGSMIFSETRAGDAPEWAEFLRLLKKSRPNCPINGLFLVLSIESLIKDSADKIAEKASRLAQQLDLIQRTLDVRFPVYLLVTKADLLTGFREFFDSIDDPLLQHQMFGWSNPEPLDSHFRPDLVEQHLKSVADRLRRRRLALLLRESSAGSARVGDTAFFTTTSVGRGQRRLDEVDALFALPESVMRLVPRLRRYLETVFVAGEWSAKPVFLRGIYFTSSMREGKALDEAIALATGVPVEQLPEDRSWEKNRAYFLRDLFVEKVFRESGLVTRATNTIQLLRKRRMAIFGTAGLALLLLIVFAVFNYSSLKRSVLQEADEWDAGAKYWNQGAWTLPIVRPTTDGGVNFAYVGNNRDVDVGSKKMSLVEYQQQIKTVASRSLDVSWVFRPLGLTSGLEGKRKAAQLKIFEHGVLKPLIANTRAKLNREPDTSAVVRHQNALLALIQLQADVEDGAKRSSGLATNVAAEYLSAYLSYLTDTDGVKADPALVDVFAWTYSREGSGRKSWPSEFLVDLKNPSVQRGLNDGLEALRKANVKNEVVISNRLVALNALTASFGKYRDAEQKMFESSGNPCGAPIQELDKVRRAIANNVADLASLGTTLKSPLTSLALCYDELANQAASASALGIERNLGSFPESFRNGSLYKQIEEQLLKFKQAASGSVLAAKNRQKDELAGLDLNYMALVGGGEQSSYEVRWSLYLSSCSLLTNRTVTSDDIVGSMGKRFGSLTTNAQYVTSGLQTYAGPFAQQVLNVCTRTIGQNSDQLKRQFVESYAKYVQGRLKELKFPLRLTATEAFTKDEFVTQGKPFVTGLEADLNDPVWKSFPASAPLLDPLRNGSHALIAKGLVNPDNTIAEMEFVFTLPARNSEEGKLYWDGWLRNLKVLVDGRDKFNEDLTRFDKKGAVVILTNVPASSQVRFEFYSDAARRNLSVSRAEDNWLLPRLIQKDQAQRLTGQETEWKLVLPVTVNNKSGTLEAFTIRLKHPLPKKEEWPK